MATTRKTPASTPPPPARHPRRLTRPHVIGLAAAAIVLLVGIYAFAAYHTVSSYQARISSGAFSYTGQLIFRGQDFLSPMNSNMAFSGTYNGAGQPQVATQFLGTWAGHEYTGDARLLDNRFYFDLSGPVMPVIRYRQGTFLFPLQAGQWYSAKADESLYNNFCEHDQPASLQSKLALYRAVKSLKLSPSPWVNFWSSAAGHRATHVSGSLSGAQLASLWDAWQKASPPGCSDPNTIGISASDLKHVSTHVDLYSGSNEDQVRITLADKTLGATASLTAATSNYGQAAGVTAPAGATDLNALFASFGLH